MRYKSVNFELMATQQWKTVTWMKYLKIKYLPLGQEWAKYGPQGISAVHGRSPSHLTQAQGAAWAAAHVAGSSTPRHVAGLR